MKVKLLSSILLFSVLSSCRGKANENDSNMNKTEGSQTLKIVKTYHFDKDSITSLEILRDEHENYILLQTRCYGDILSVVGEGNIDFLDGKLKLDTVFFENDKEVFVLPTYVYGSTYGAVAYFLVYKNNYPNDWEIFKIPFDRLDIKTDNNGLSRILEYTSCDKEIEYYFKNGLLEQIR